MDFAAHALVAIVVFIQTADFLIPSFGLGLRELG